jgi:hypothetical protein
MCNHCPYVVAVQQRINQLLKTTAELCAGWNKSNDPIWYPEDYLRIYSGKRAGLYFLTI